MDSTNDSHPFRLELEICAPERLPALRRIFEALKRAKERQFQDDASEDGSEGWEDAESPYWANFLDEEAKEHFARSFDFSSEEGRTYMALLELTHHSRRTDPIFNTPGPWDFESVIDAILNGEYLLLDLVETDESQAVLRYDPLAGPFGGTESLVELVDGFGQRVIHDSWHEGPHRRSVVGWDFERARRLVEEGRGIE